MGHKKCLISTCLKGVVILIRFIQIQKDAIFQVLHYFSKMHFYFFVIVVSFSLVSSSPTHAAHASGVAPSQHVMTKNEKYLGRKKRAFWNLPINVNEWLYNNDDFYDDLIYSASHYHN